jgi:hypothetical protein
MASRALSLCALCVFPFTVAYGPGNFTQVLNWGDSWAWLGQAELKAELAAHGVKLTTHAIPGSPVAAYVATPKILMKAVKKSKAQAVVLSIGGNDFLEGMPKFHSPDKILAEMLVDTDRILMPLFEAFPDVHVYQFGYEILDWAGSAACKRYSGPEFRGVCSSWMDTTCCVKTQQKYLQTLYVDALAAKYHGKYNYHGVNLLGTLQKAGGVPGADVGKPVLTKYSPSQFVRLDSSVLGCVHLTISGYTVLYKELIKKMGFMNTDSNRTAFAERQK